MEISFGKYYMINNYCGVGVFWWHMRSPVLRSQFESGTPLFINPRTDHLVVSRVSHRGIGRIAMM